MSKKPRTSAESGVETKGISSTRVRFSIRMKLLGVLLPAVMLVIAAILLLVYSNTSGMIRQKGQELLSAGTDSVVNQVSGWLNRAIVSIEMERDTLEQLATTPEGERAYVNHSATLYADLPTGIYFGTPDGRVVHPTFFPDSTYHVTEKGWYQDGLKSESFVISPVYVDAATGSNVVTLSSVLKNPDGSVRGVAATDIFLDAIAAIVAPVQFEQTGGMFLVDISTGTIIGHKNPELVGAVLAQQENPIYGYLAEQLAAKQTGEKIYTAADGIETWLDLAPVPGTDWAAVAYVPGSEVMSELNTLTQTLIAIAVAAILVLICIISLLVRFAVMRPMKEIDHVARQIADGKLNESIRFRSGDEFGALAVNFNQTVARLRDYVNYIDEISAVLHEIARGKLSFQLQYEYVGEFAKVKDALVQISQSLNSTMRQINDSSDQVTLGAQQVSGGAQALAQGATEQASSIEELAASINEVSQQVRHNADSAQSAKTSSLTVAADILQSNGKMREMIDAMAHISSKSDEIGKIIKTIEDIAFQTNILALNAAVEAARAGTAGKGFAVVADEVRNLASKSSEAAKNTTELIAQTVSAVENGTAIADDTAASMLTVVENTKQVTEIVEKIANESAQQAASVAQITIGIDQISAVVQTNSATAEESAAASSELLGQAKILRGLVSQFELSE